MKPFTLGILLSSPVWVGIALIPPYNWLTAVQLLVPPLGSMVIFGIASFVVNRGWVK